MENQNDIYVTKTKKYISKDDLMKYLDEILTAKIIRQKEINTRNNHARNNDTPNECEHGKIIKIAEEYQLIEFLS